MSSADLGDLYRDVIIEHSRQPRNFRRIDGAARHAEGLNPLCGDQLTVYVDLDGDRITDVAFEGAGCAISQASASLMTTELKGRTCEEALEVFAHVHAMLTDDAGDAHQAALGKLAVLAGVRAYPMRVKCATLAWHTLRSALEPAGEGAAS